MAKQDTSAHWRDSGLTPLLFYVDARGAFAILLVLLRPHWYTVAIAVVVLTFLSVLNYYKIPLIAAFRLLRAVITGPKKIRVERK